MSTLRFNTWQNTGGTEAATASEVSAYSFTEPALVFISRTTIGTAVSSVTVSDAFSADYDSYKITVQGGASSTPNGLWLTLGATTTGYYNVQLYQVYTSGNTTANSTAGTNQGQWQAGRGDTTTLTLNADVHSPFASEYTTIGYQWFRANDAIGYGGGYLNNTTSYTAFTITASTGTITGGTIDVYGYAKA